MIWGGEIEGMLERSFMLPMLEWWENSTLNVLFSQRFSDFIRFEGDQDSPKFTSKCTIFLLVPTILIAWTLQNKDVGPGLAIVGLGSSEN